MPWISTHGQVTHTFQHASQIISIIKPAILLLSPHPPKITSSWMLQICKYSYTDSATEDDIQPATYLTNLSWWPYRYYQIPKGIWYYPCNNCPQCPKYKHTICEHVGLLSLRNLISKETYQIFFLVVHHPRTHDKVFSDRWTTGVRLVTGEISSETPYRVGYSQSAVFLVSVNSLPCMCACIYSWFI
jgi:hypothetical protein